MYGGTNNIRSIKCTRGGLICEYPEIGTLVKTTATKSQLPGVAAPWQLMKQVSPGEPDPFDALPISMPFQSINLLRICS